MLIVIKYNNYKDSNLCFDLIFLSGLLDREFKESVQKLGNI